MTNRCCRSGGRRSRRGGYGGGWGTSARASSSPVIVVGRGCVCGCEVEAVETDCGWFRLGWVCGEVEYWGLRTIGVLAKGRRRVGWVAVDGILEEEKGEGEGVRDSCVTPCPCWSAGSGGVEAAAFPSFRCGW